MSATRRMYDEAFKKNAVKLSYASNKSVGQVAKDLGISDGMLYRWRAKYTPEGDKTRYATVKCPCGNATVLRVSTVQSKPCDRWGLCPQTPKV